ncbi:MAG TPA: hypothetical protein VEF33_10825 [Syntrophales bacterium]|nr:hypothetical protein [Syntrophales bacterium]
MEIKYKKHRAFLIVFGLLLTILGVSVFPTLSGPLFTISLETITAIVILGLTLIGGPLLIFIGIKGDASSINKAISIIYNKDNKRGD